MANSNLLKEAIADAKAVRETAIANAKIALEEAFTPRLQSILSQKLQQEIEEGEEDDDKVDENDVVEGTYNADGEEEITAEGDDKEKVEELGSSDIGKSDNSKPSKDASDSSNLKEEESDEESEKETVSEEESEEKDPTDETYSEEESEEESDDELDLESIIKELEAELDGDSHDEDSTDETYSEELDDEESEEVSDIASDEIESHEDEHHSEEVSEEGEEHSDEEDDMDEEIDLDEILREMGYGDKELSEEESDEESDEEKVDETNELEEVKTELTEAMSTIKELKSTINEVNLLNAKLLYTNKLFRAYELNNDQKHKVVETLDRTGNVREVKLVFSTLAESFKINGTSKKQKVSKKITESFASKPVASTAPKKEVITESTNTMADRFKKLANIN